MIDNRTREELVATTSAQNRRLIEAYLEIERLRAALKGSANQLEWIAFGIQAPNEHTPKLVMLANSMRTLEQLEDKK